MSDEPKIIYVVWPVAPDWQRRVGAFTSKADAENWAEHMNGYDGHKFVVRLEVEGALLVAQGTHGLGQAVLGAQRGGQTGHGGEPPQDARPCIGRERAPRRERGLRAGDGRVRLLHARGLELPKLGRGLVHGIALE